MSEIILPRRQFLAGLGATAIGAFAAPAIVRAASLMPVHAYNPFSGDGAWLMDVDGKITSLYRENGADIDRFCIMARSLVAKPDTKGLRFVVTHKAFMQMERQVIRERYISAIDSLRECPNKPPTDFRGVPIELIS